VAVIAIAGDDLVARPAHGLNADGDGLLTDVEVAEATDQAHAVELAGALLEAADQQHFAVPGQELVAGNASIRGGRGRRLPRLPSRSWTRHSLLP